MTPRLYSHADVVDLIAPKQWDDHSAIATLQARFEYLIEVAEHEGMDWSDVAGRWLPSLDGWFVCVLRPWRSYADFFPNAWERSRFRLPRDLTSRCFDWGELDEMIDLGLEAKRAFEEAGHSALTVFRPGVHWVSQKRRARVARPWHPTGSAA